MSTTLVRALADDPSTLSRDLGLGLVTRAARLVLFSGLNDELARQQDKWLEADLALQSLGMDPGVGQVEVTPVAPANFYEGPGKTLVKSPPSAFPNVNVMAYMTVASPSQAFDQAQSSDITLFIESMAISGPVDEGAARIHEAIVHRRIERMTEAVAAVIEANPTLLGTIHELRTPPRGGIGNNSWLNSTNEGAGDRYLWHGSRLQYTLTRHHS
jgi:hypothetical protein